MTDQNYDQLLHDYKQAIDAYIAALRHEESLAQLDHTMVPMEHWDTAAFAVHDAELTAKKARDAYKNALRRKNYGF
jgi:crotonobetainyl-CoA:carnitine CoA-transferase CaiB-like acyl-CoA transferase